MESVTIGQVVVGIILLSSLVQALVVLRGSWRKWLQHEIRSMRESVEAVQHEMKPNSGKSLVDKVNRIETALRGLNRRLDAIESKVDSSE